MKTFQLFWRMAVLILLVVIGVILIIRVDTMLDRRLEPIQELSGKLSTQVSRALNPTPTILPDPVTIVHDVRSLARLETIKYSMEKVITAETRQGALQWLVGDRLLLVAHGEVIAGMDLQKLQPEDLRLKNGVLYIDLPEPEVFLAALDDEQSYVYDRETGFLTQGEVDLETEARRAAAEEIERSALEDGILEKAEQNARSFLEKLFLDLGFPDVIFE